MSKQMQTTTNVDYLLENFTISEIEDIESKLRTDVDRKKQELKQLVGERYRDLMEAADTIQHMNVSVNHVLQSLLLLDGAQNSNLLLVNNKRFNLSAEHEENSQMVRHLNDKYKIACIIKMIVTTPLNIWSAIQNDDLSLSTYLYFHGIFLCDILKKCLLPNESLKLLSQYEAAILRFNQIIVDKSWSLDKYRCLAEEMDESISSDTYCCLLLLKQLTPSQLFNILLEKRQIYIIEIFAAPIDLKQTLTSFFNILFNSIKCIYFVFFKIENKTLLQQRYTNLLKFSHDFPNTSHFLFSSQNMKDLTNFKIPADSNIVNVDLDVIKRESLNWIKIIKNLIQPYIKQLLNTIKSAKYICQVLNDIYIYQKQRQMLSSWDEYCEDLIEIYLPFWDEFMMEFINARIKSIINENISKVTVLLKENIENQIINNKNISNKDFEVFSFVWDDSESSALSLANKAIGQIPLIDQFCTNFDASIEFLLNDVQMIKDGNFKLIDENNLHEIECHLINECQKMIIDIKDYLTLLMTNMVDNDVILIFCAQFLRHLTQSCPHLRQCFETSTNKSQISWFEVKELLLSSSYSAFKKLFDSIIVKLFKRDLIEEWTTFHNFVDNCLVWDKIIIEEESEEGKVISSTIEIPLQISMALHNNLYQLCCYVNRISGHTLPRVVTINLLSSLTNILSNIYESVYNRLLILDYPTNMKQTFSLQLYFDLLFVKQILGSSRDDVIKFQEMPKIQECLQKFETLIDPFDLHVYFPHIQTNLAKIGMTSTIIFGSLIPDTNIRQNLKSAQHYNEQHNILSFNSYQKLFPLLNVNNFITKSTKK